MDPEPTAPAAPLTPATPGAEELEELEEWRDPARALQMLSTEHWSLLASRSLVWNECFARSGLYLTVLSASVVALALVSQATDFDGRFAAFASVLMTVVFFIGVTTVIRINQANIEDVLWTGGMNRIRHAYVELEPRLTRYLVTSMHDDAAGVLISMGAPPNARPSAAHMFVTSPGMLTVVNSVVGAVTFGLSLAALGAPVWAAVLVGVTTFLVVLGVLLGYQMHSFTRLVDDVETRFPSPPLLPGQRLRH